MSYIGKYFYIIIDWKLITFFDKKHVMEGEKSEKSRHIRFIVCKVCGE